MWVITGVVEHSWGWVISWVNKRAAQASQDTRDMYAGGGPFLVKRADGRVAMGGPTVARGGPASRRRRTGGTGAGDHDAVVMR